MSTGIPVVGYDIGALSEIINDRDLLAPPGDSRRLAEIINELLDDRGRRIEIGSKNRSRAHEMFSVAAMIDSYHSLYVQLIGAGR
jgi:glycosyltransferase involved in cell wall biosynthesis